MSGRFAGKRVLVTGGAGFIGSHLVDSLVREGASVRIFDNFSSGLAENLAEVRDDVEVIEGDILDAAALAPAFRNIDIVTHQAAQLEITRAVEDPIEDLTTNTIGTLNVLNASVAADVPRVILASSAGVYGQAKTTPQDEDEHGTDPNWPYGVSKLATEKYAAIYQELHGTSITSLRYAIVYGPREWYGRVLTIFLKRALEGQPLVVFGDGKQVRDFVCVEDVVEHHNRCIESEAASGQVFNISTGVGTDINALAELVREVTDQPDLPILHEDVREGETSQYYERKRLPMELRSLVQSTRKSKKLLDWEPRVALREGLKREYEWLQASPYRWERMSY
jgi:UDP-glucose 4-epimerase